MELIVVGAHVIEVVAAHATVVWVPQHVGGYAIAAVRGGCSVLHVGPPVLLGIVDCGGGRRDAGSGLEGRRCKISLPREEVAPIAQIGA